MSRTSFVTLLGDPGGLPAGLLVFPFFSPIFVNVYFLFRKNPGLVAGAFCSAGILLTGSSPGLPVYLSPGNTKVSFLSICGLNISFKCRYQVFSYQLTDI